MGFMPAYKTYTMALILQPLKPPEEVAARPLLRQHRHVHALLAHGRRLGSTPSGGDAIGCSHLLYLHLLDTGLGAGLQIIECQTRITQSLECQQSSEENKAYLCAGDVRRRGSVSINNLSQSMAEAMASTQR
jgi:hypothetical protein